jgi:Cft2 family RNA processing exonuclease
MRLNFKIHQIEPLKPFTVGPYSVAAFPANHAPGMGAMLYAIENDGRSVSYGRIRRRYSNRLGGLSNSTTCDLML